MSGLVLYEAYHFRFRRTQHSRLGLDQGVFGLHRRPPRQVLLVPLPLRVRQIVPLVVVERETQLTLVLPEMISHEVRVLVQVHRLLRQLPQPLPTIDSGLALRHHPTPSEL